MSKRRMTDDELTAEFLVRTAAREAALREHEELEAAAQDESIEIPPDDRADALGERIRKMEHSYTALQKRNRCWQMAGRAAACLVICAVGVLGAGSVAFQVSAEARGTIATMLIRNFGEYTQIEVLEGYALEKPFGWTSEYYPTWIPKGYRFDRMDLNDHIEALYYVNSMGQEIVFQCSEFPSNGYNSEDRAAEKIEICGYKGLIFQGDTPLTKILVLFADKKIVISSDIPYLELIQMADSIAGL